MRYVTDSYALLGSSHANYVFRLTPTVSRIVIFAVSCFWQLSRGELSYQEEYYAAFLDLCVHCHTCHIKCPIATYISAPSILAFYSAKILSLSFMGTSSIPI